MTEIHRALGAGEIASDEASRLVDFVGRTARVLASKAVAEIDFADRLARVEEILVALLKADTARRAQEAKPSEMAPASAPQPAAAPAIANNNAESMGPVAAEAAQPVATKLAEPGVIENNNGNTMGEAPERREAWQTSQSGSPDAADPPMSAANASPSLADAA